MFPVHAPCFAVTALRSLPVRSSGQTRGTRRASTCSRRSLYHALEGCRSAEPGSGAAALAWPVVLALAARHTAPAPHRPASLPTAEKWQALYTILEAFGNSSTGMNGNATRFSQIISLDFDQAGQVASASVQVRGQGGPPRHGSRSILTKVAPSAREPVQPHQDGPLGAGVGPSAPGWPPRHRTQSILAGVSLPSSPDMQQPMSSASAPGRARSAWRPGVLLSSLFTQLCADQIHSPSLLS